MQKKFIKLLKKLRRRYIERHDLPQPRPLNKERDPDIISSHIREKLLSPEPVSYTHLTLPTKLEV